MPVSDRTRTSEADAWTDHWTSLSLLCTEGNGARSGQLYDITIPMAAVRRTLGRTSHIRDLSYYAGLYVPGLDFVMELYTPGRALRVRS